MVAKLPRSDRRPEVYRIHPSAPNHFGARIVKGGNTSWGSGSRRKWPFDQQLSVGRTGVASGSFWIIWKGRATLASYWRRFRLGRVLRLYVWKVGASLDAAEVPMLFVGIG